jgi:hypothetical protein
MLVTARGPKSASARPGPCTRPRSADALARREYHPARQTPRSSSFVLGHWRRPQGRPQDAGGLRALQLDPGSRMAPRRAHRAGPIAELLGGDSELTRCPRRNGSSGERIGGRARWRRHPGRRTRWQDRARAGGLPARRRPQQDACPWTCQRFARAYATGPLAPPHSSLCDPAFELWQHAAAWCCARSRELAAPP